MVNTNAPMSGLPSALLAKWATPFDHKTAKLKTYCELQYVGAIFECSGVSDVGIVLSRYLVSVAVLSMDSCAFVHTYMNLQACMALSFICTTASGSREKRY